MKISISILLFFVFTNCLFGQKWDKETICYTDTVIIEKVISKKIKHKTIDSIYSYKAVQCITRSKFGIRMGVGISNYYFGNKTTEWLGQYGGLNINYSFNYGKINIGTSFMLNSFKTLKPKKDLEFNRVLLSNTAELSTDKFDINFGYSFDFDYKISVEPFVGYDITNFYVINEDYLQQEYSIPTVSGPILGLTLNKYLKFGNNAYFALYGKVGYSFVDYSKVHNDLDFGHLEWSLGIAIKKYVWKRIFKKVE